MKRSIQLFLSSAVDYRSRLEVRRSFEQRQKAHLKHDLRCSWRTVVVGASGLRACAFDEFWDFPEVSNYDQQEGRSHGKTSPHTCIQYSTQNRRRR